MSDIRPIDLPTAAGVEFGRGDVRHFSEDDAVGVVGLQTPTRHLAERDNLLASKVNELVTVVNNKEQFVPLPVPRTVIGPGSEEIVTNFKIPDGFEARIVNAAVGSSPASSSAVLKIYYATGYGNTSGTELVSTSSTFNSGVAFYNTGEFIVALRNTGALNLEVVASITLTVRPIGSTASLLVGSVIQGEKGLRGDKGDKGLKGDAGVGGTGSPGLVWSGVFNAANSYAPPQAVSYTSGGITQSYISKLANPGPGSQLPTNGTYWDLIAGAAPATALTPAQFRWMGGWSGATTYVSDSSYIDIVSYASGGITGAYICVVASSLNRNPVDFPADWDVFATPGGETPVYTHNVLSGVGGGVPKEPYLVFGGTYAPGVATSSYGSLTPGVTRNLGLAFDEWKIINSTSTPQGMAFLSYKLRASFKGDVYVRMPHTSNGAVIDWATDTVHCIPTLESFGTAAYSGTAIGTTAVNVVEYGTTSPHTTTLYHIDVVSQEPKNVAISFLGLVSVN